MYYCTPDFPIDQCSAGENLPAPPVGGGRGGSLGSGGSERRGLSTAHISTLPCVTTYPDGGLLTVVRSSGGGGDRCGGGRRGIITEFSRSSRRRLMRLLAMVRRDALPLFVTLTYPDEYPRDLAVWATHFERFRARLARRGWGAIWRREFQVRKSGKNAGNVAPHYHLLVWGATLADRGWVSRAWWECCGKLSDDHLRAGTRVEVIRSWRGVMSYASKYVAKVGDGISVGSTGRWWGWINRGAIPWASAVTLSVTMAVANTLVRMMRRYARMRSWGGVAVVYGDVCQSAALVACGLDAVLGVVARAGVPA